MEFVELTQHPLFENFCEFDIDGSHIDLHNDFTCTSVAFSRTSGQLLIDFRLSEPGTSSIEQVKISFEDIIVDTFNFQGSKDYRGFWTIDLMYRERFENSDGTLGEELDGRNFFYIGFYEEYVIELFARKVTAQVVKTL